MSRYRCCQAELSRTHAVVLDTLYYMYIHCCSEEQAHCPRFDAAQIISQLRQKYSYYYAQKRLINRQIMCCLVIASVAGSL